MLEVYSKPEKGNSTAYVNKQLLSSNLLKFKTISVTSEIHISTILHLKNLNDVPS